MSLRLSRRALRAAPTPRPALAIAPRLLSTKPDAEPAAAPTTPTPPARNMDPTPMKAQPQFPAPADPFNPSEAPGAAGRTSPTYSEGTKTLVKGVAKLMGYNSKASTAIRETGRMMRGVVEAVETDRAFWYDSCKLPPTYQSFFQLHLLYVLLLVIRLRALPAGGHGAAKHPIPEPLDSSAPQQPASHSHPAPTGIHLGKAAHETYPTELLSHFFELAESQMRMVLGKGERESVIKKYMEEMGEQWKGASAGLDYVVGLGLSEGAEEAASSDVELASWAWRNLFASRGLTAPVEGGDELAFVTQLELVVRFVRRELSRLDAVSDEDVLNGNIGDWGRLEQ
ncbi:Serine carboxypeptidase 3 [Vanrija albida]|uniref:Serine carboxypeptidase 3 n=1 Tax=Vanrija albida TaxID=181172 RepID=A0ABR3Q6J3_9TREE